MEVSIHANVVDHTTSHMASILWDPLETIGKDLSNDYGGTMEHLWIHFELNPFHAELRPPYPFRYQKKVGGSRNRFTGWLDPVCKNVGHYSVRPNFKKLLRLPRESVTSYALSLIYESTSVLIAKQKRLGGFDAERFRRDFLLACGERGYKIVDPHHEDTTVDRILKPIRRLFFGNKIEK